MKAHSSLFFKFSKEIKMKQAIQFIIIPLLISALVSCGHASKEEGKTPLARVYDKYLYYEDIADMIPHGLSATDSINKIKTFVDFWVKRQAITKTAEINLAEEQKDVAKELEDYRMDLLIFRYKQKFIEQNLDTIVTQKQINDFYDAHQAEFKLAQPAVKATYIKILKTTPNISMIKSLYRSSREKDIEQVKNYCDEHAAVYNDYNNDWIYFKDLIIEIPTAIDNQENYLKTKSYVEAEDSVYVYLANIKNYRLKDAIAPEEFVGGNIQSIILKQRKQKLIDDVETNIYNNMLDKEEIELFDNQ